MSAVLSHAAVFRPMRISDLEAILAIEQKIYTHPWTEGNFRDSLLAGYSCWVMDYSDCLAGYGVLMMGVREAHLLNLSIATDWQRRGLGRILLHHFIRVARGVRGSAHLPRSAPVQPGCACAVCGHRVPRAVCAPQLLSGRSWPRGCHPHGTGPVKSAECTTIDAT